MPTLSKSILIFLDWLKKTEGRDKLYRLIAYGSKIPIHVLSENKDLVKRLKSGASAVGLSRKLMRMFKSLQYLQDFMLILDVEDVIEKSIGIFKSVSLFVWMVIDHVQWMHKVGYLRVSNEKKLSELHSKCWFFGLLAGVILNFYKLKTKDSSKSNKYKKGIVKNSIDLVIPSARLEWINCNDAVVGIAGTITSCMGIYESWPRNKHAF